MPKYQVIFETSVIEDDATVVEADSAEEAEDIVIENNTGFQREVLITEVVELPKDWGHDE